MTLFSYVPMNRHLVFRKRPGALLANACVASLIHANQFHESRYWNFCSSHSADGFAHEKTESMSEYLKKSESTGIGV
jgi:hypothetical protein